MLLLVLAASMLLAGCTLAGRRIGRQIDNRNTEVYQPSLDSLEQQVEIGSNMVLTSTDSVVYKGIALIIEQDKRLVMETKNKGGKGH